MVEPSGSSGVPPEVTCRVLVAWSKKVSVRVRATGLGGSFLVLGFFIRLSRNPKKQQMAQSEANRTMGEVKRDSMVYSSLRACWAAVTRST